MQLFSMRRVAVTLGAVAALALGTGIVPSMTGHTSPAQAAELSQHGGGHGGGHQGGGNQGGQGGHNGGGHQSFGGHRFHSSSSFSHTYWGWGFHRYYPQYYVTYYYEPVSVCENYYFDDDGGAWYCFTGY